MPRIAVAKRPVSTPVVSKLLVCEDKTCKSTSENDPSVVVRAFKLWPSGDTERAILCDTHTKEMLG